MLSRKISTSDAARRLRDHPANVVRDVSEMVTGLDDCWPELDEGFVDTLKTLRGVHQPEQIDEHTKSAEPAIAPASKPRRSSAALKVLDKLERKDKWGGNAIGWDTLRNHYCHGVSGLDDAVDDLVREEFLLAGESRDGPYSLNPARKGEIESLVEEWRRKRV